MNHTATAKVDVTLLNVGLCRLMSIAALAGIGGVLLEHKLPGATICADMAILCYSLLYVLFPSMSGALSCSSSELFYGHLPNVFSALFLRPFLTFLLFCAWARAAWSKTSDWLKHITSLLLLLLYTHAKCAIEGADSDFRPYSRYLILLGHALPLRSPPCPLALCS